MATELKTDPAARAARWEDLLIVDVDLHGHETPEALAKYTPLPWRHAVENLIGVPERYLDLPGLSPRAEYMAPFPGGIETRAVLDAEQMVDELGRLSIDVGVLFPDSLLRLAVFPQARWATALAGAYNEWLLTEWADIQRGLLACVAVVPQDPEWSAREIERYAGEAAVVGVYLPTAAVNPLWGDRRYDPIFAAAEAAGLPVLLHGATIVHPVFPCQLEQFDTYLAQHTLGHTLGMIANLVSMVTTGVPVRFPRMKIAFAEAGVSWVPFIMNRLDTEYLLRRREVPFLEDRPSTYVKQMFFATQPIEEPADRRHLEQILALFGGADSVMFASDWPHPDFDHPEKIAQLLPTPEVQANIFGQNARRFFDLDERGRPLRLDR
jgi:predicted TIM-barrel fold metal-dependent hydrolase